MHTRELGDREVKGEEKDRNFNEVNVDACKGMSGV
jgi:hypothetical protein